eukprot:CAMPEP_0180137356 /NCGR_PEP_ID=MMETSP0986-20121125/12155_1 /TAXON_ID=697907 /ORGANISM="non described non described, Strain CCMP2293" /LENGTH=78 /DNA_ID=CAMNT_0022078785 /DNA_START=179 /DNA_END=415 /DNA_ORIENTATION=+
MFGLLVQCVQWEDRAAGICGTLHTVTAQNKEEVSDTACLRGPGGPCTYIGSASGVGSSWTGDHSSADSMCSSFDPEFC